MTGATPDWGLPYPEADTLITDSAAIVQDLAEKIDVALSSVTASNSYTIPGTLAQDFTTSGTFTPPAGVTLVHVAIIGGGGNGHTGTGTNIWWPGGNGGEVAVHRNVPVSGPVEIIIGGSNTASSFGALTGRGGLSPGSRWPATTWGMAGAGQAGPQGDIPTSYNGHNGAQVNSTWYGGGGGAGFHSGGSAVSGGSGGAGGGGRGMGWTAANYPVNSTGGTNGLGGGGGANTYSSYGSVLGGSGRVMIWTEQTLFTTLDLPADAVPRIVAGLDEAGVMLGEYAVNETMPVGTGCTEFVDYPDEPVDTGRTVLVPIDPEDPESLEMDVPIMLWPVQGWRYTNNKWEEPNE